jgi:CBS domain-containing protein
MVTIMAVSTLSWFTEVAARLQDKAATLACRAYSDPRGGSVLTQVGDLLDDKGTDVFSIAPGASVAQAVELMTDRGVGSLLVMLDGELRGIITERDYTRKVIAGGLSTEDTRVSDIMTADVYTAGVGQNIDECMMLMTEKRIRHLPVVDGKRVLGIISIGDLMKAIISDNQRALGALDQPAD